MGQMRPTLPQAKTILGSFCEHILPSQIFPLSVLVLSYLAVMNKVQVIKLKARFENPDSGTDSPRAESESTRAAQVNRVVLSRVGSIPIQC